MTNNPLKRPVSNAGGSNVVKVDEPSRKRDKITQQNDDSSDDDWSMSSSPTPDSLQSGFLWGISSVESGLNALKVLRLKEFCQQVYIPPIARASLQVKDEDVFFFMDNVNKFLSSNREVMLILGDSGAGKSTFNRHLEPGRYAKVRSDLFQEAVIAPFSKQVEDYVALYILLE
ncbi:hypothetical protein BGX30_010520 [Mortierella sp. GBA39]|nr:hypothetical protein BGX30_010520 [Mortierella sp. GBA39]